MNQLVRTAGTVLIGSDPRLGEIAERALCRRSMGMNRAAQFVAGRSVAVTGRDRVAEA
jgi:hypothetical protein